MAISLALSNVTWHEGNQIVRRVALTASCAMLGKSVLRLGCIELNNLFITDRLCCVLLWCAAWRLPVFLYWAVVASCVTTYLCAHSVSLPLPYSNYLGFEYCRWVSSYCIVVLAYEGAVGGHNCCAVGAAVVIIGTGSYYFNQAIGKLRMAGGSEWFNASLSLAWVQHNRLQNLFINSYLRGWLNTWLSLHAYVNLARLVSIPFVRQSLGLSVILFEISGCVVAAHPTVAVIHFVTVAKFHTAVFVLTGLCDWEGIIVQLTTAATVWDSTALAAVYSTKSLAVTGVVWCVLNEWWINKVMQYGEGWSLKAHSWFGWLTGGPKEAWKLRAFFDAADLIMAWWDAPMQRMYTYSVQTTRGVWYRFPVTLFSPFDTLLTDIQTRLNFSHLYPKLDLQGSSDAKVVRSGVWGLLLYKKDADDQYAMQDDPLTMLFDRAQVGIDVMVTLPDGGATCRCTVVSTGRDTRGDFVSVHVGADSLAQRRIYRNEWDGKWVDATPADAIRTHFNPSERSWTVTPRSRAAKAKVGCWTVTTATPLEAMPAATFIRDFVVALNRKANGEYNWLWQWLWWWPHFPGEDLVSV